MARNGRSPSGASSEESEHGDVGDLPVEADRVAADRCEIALTDEVVDEVGAPPPVLGIERRIRSRCSISKSLACNMLSSTAAIDGRSYSHGRLRSVQHSSQITVVSTKRRSPR
jgi:hypothetical protein